MREFKILPTDERFLSLEPEQKEIIFEAYNYLPDNETVSAVFGLTKRKEELTNKPASDFVVESVKKQLTKAFKRMKRSDEEIEEALREQGQTRKNIEVAEVQKKLNAFLGIKEPDINKGKREELLKRRGEKIKKIEGKKDGGKEK